MKTIFKMIITVCLTAVFAFGNAAQVAFDRGMDAKYEAELDEALKQFTQAVKLDPNYAEVHCNHGTAYYV
jgi:Tfp pilus assembly protein PilF